MVLNQTIRSISEIFVRIVVAVSVMASTVLCDAEQIKSADEQFVVAKRIYPAIGREDELESRLIRETQLAKKLGSQSTFRLERSVNEPIFFVFHQVYPSRAAFETRREEITQAVHKELGPLPEGILARLSEIEYFRILVD